MIEKVKISNVFRTNYLENRVCDSSVGSAGHCAIAFAVSFSVLTIFSFGKRLLLRSRLDGRNNDAIKVLIYPDDFSIPPKINKLLMGRSLFKLTNYKPVE